MSFITRLLSGVPVTGGYDENGDPSGILNNGGNIHPGGFRSGLIGKTGVYGGACASAGCGTWSWARSANTPIITVPSGISGVTGINPNGPWNYSNPTGVIQTVTSGIASRANTSMQGGASNSAAEMLLNCTHWTRSPLYKSAVLSGWWSEYRGQFSFMTDETLTTPSGGLWNISNGAVLSSCTGQTQDSQDEPGEIVYNMGGIPTQTGYGPRYNW